MVFSIQILGRLHALTRRHGLVVLVAGAATLAGCGQKGPLFLPVPPVVPAAATATATPVTTPANPAPTPASPASAPP
ncbi:lipoprotein [Polaromonas sp.]|uniref:LPS translocon maturation chaperone LptM n=1 Tax=Polaromonas sp. TaxID=1869339 RepID=UPI001DAE79BE|nr:lipoprotein [Polaromonas sp.]MBT9476926.1 lipoprotein [Polaromonas sp.]